MKIFKLLFVLLVVFILPITDGFTQVQRMGVPKGTYKIHANGSIRIDSYCLDYTRAQPSSKNIFKFVLDNVLDALVDNAGKKFNLQEAIDKGFIEITGKKVEPVEFMNLVKTSLTQPDIPIEVRKQNEKLLKMWESSPIADRKDIKTLFNLSNCINANFFEIPEKPDNILYPIKKSWPFIPDSIKSLFNAKYSYLLESARTQIQKQIDDIKDYRWLQFYNKTNSDIVLTLKDDLILGETKENCDLLIQMLTGIEFKDQSQIWNTKVAATLKILAQSKCDDESIEDVMKRYNEAIICFQKKNNISPTGIIDEQTEKLLLDEYKKMK